MSLYKKLTEPRIWRRIFYERLTEPIHLNIISLFVAAFGSFARKVEFDLVLRAPYAFGVLGAAQRARRYGIKEITVIEFGVSSGAGLMNMSALAEQAERATCVKINVVALTLALGCLSRWITATILICMSTAISPWNSTNFARSCLLAPNWCWETWQKRCRHFSKNSLPR